MSQLVTIQNPPQIIQTFSEDYSIFESPFSFDSQGILHFHPKKMEVGQSYSIMYNSIERVFRKVAERVIDMYDVVPESQENA